MKTSSRWNGLIVPLALGLGSAVGVVVDRQVLLRFSWASDRVAVAELAPAQEAPAAGPKALPGPEPQGLPFDPFSDAGPGEMAEAAPIQVDPPLVARGRRVELDPPPGYFDLPAPDKKDGTDPPLVKTGQRIQVEVLEALPGRPITGERIVRPDGTISLGFYGDLRVAGLNRYQIKVKLLEHLREYITDEVLGLVLESLDGTVKAKPPVESNRVFIDESLNDYSAGPEPVVPPTVRVGYPDQAPTNGRLADLENKLDRVLKELEKSRQVRTSAEPGDGAKPR